MSRGKQSIALDFKNAEGRDVFKRLIKTVCVGGMLFTAASERTKRRRMLLLNHFDLA
jgi:hypothetical protein